MKDQTSKFNKVGIPIIQFNNLVYLTAMKVTCSIKPFEIVGRNILNVNINSSKKDNNLSSI